MCDINQLINNALKHPCLTLITQRSIIIKRTKRTANRNLIRRNMNANITKQRTHAHQTT